RRPVAPVRLAWLKTKLPRAQKRIIVVGCALHVHRVSKREAGAQRVRQLNLALHATRAGLELPIRIRPRLALSHEQLCRAPEGRINPTSRLEQDHVRRANQGRVAARADLIVVELYVDETRFALRERA